jgi:hypothetical protein
MAHKTPLLKMAVYPNWQLDDRFGPDARFGIK